MAELLTAVRLVCTRLPPSLAALLYVPVKVDAFLLPSLWSLESASKLGFVRLLDRLLKLEWPGFNSECRAIRLTQTVEDAMDYEYNVHVLEWWLTRYMPDQTVFPLARVLKRAIQRSQFPVLEWLHKETKGELPHLSEPLLSTDPDVVAWLLDHYAAQVCCWLSLCGRWKLNASFQSVQRCLAYQNEDSSFQINGDLSSF